MSFVRAQVIGLFTLVIAGCSGASSTEISDDPITGSSPATPAPSASSPAKSTPATPTNPTGPDGTPTPTTPPATDPTQPVEPPDAAKCTAEAEPNDAAGKATAFTSSLCGKIDSASDVDFGTFVVPPGARSIFIEHSEKGGNVRYAVTVNGIPAPFLDGGNMQLDVIAGATYMISARGPVANANARPTYEIDVSFK